jgi:hypothetical protein
MSIDIKPPFVMMNVTAFSAFLSIFGLPERAKSSFEAVFGIIY